ncbi:MAG: ATP-binding protein [Acidobacteriota bacterium]
MATPGAAPRPEVNAFPAKAFFVTMLTRDIELKDAILDLLDNCVDGAMRVQAARGELGLESYKDFWAKIALDPTSISIEDNCGGITIDTAKKSAFRLGRVGDLDVDIPTVGVYGIGMKRAIFKLGRDAIVESKTDAEAFTVVINELWMNNDQEWMIPMLEGESSLSKAGTRIRVKQLEDNVSRLFSDETGFLQELKKTISAYYGLIIEKGFRVSVNNEEIPSTQTGLLLGEEGFEATGEIMPYVYHAEHQGVDVSVVIGFYRNLPDEEEEEESLQGRPTSEQAGITIVCNDRVVIYADKTRLTGWGEATVPGYHTQFVSIAGLVTFRANDAALLPVTTTKRGLDANSELYLMVKEFIREGIKYFTDFTNKWKRAPVERRSVQRNARTFLPASIVRMVPENRRSVVRGGIGGWKVKPHLPLPKEDDPMRQVKFNRKQSEISTVGRYLLDDPAANPSDVGQRCFDDVLKKVRR